MTAEEKAVYNSAWRAAHPGYSRQWRAAHPEKAREQYVAHREQRAAYARKRRATHSARVLQISRKASAKWRAAHRQERAEYERRYRAEHSGKVQAKDAVHNAIAAGRLLKQPCEWCNVNAEAHHPSYAPEHRLTVLWLCPRHHKLIHTLLKQS